MNRKKKAGGWLGSLGLRLAVMAGLLASCMGLAAAETMAPAGTSAGRSAAVAGATATAVKAEEQKPVAERILNFFNDGGPLMWAILVSSVVGLTFTLERLVSLRMKVHTCEELEERTDWLLENESCAAALSYLREKSCTQARALAAVLQRCTAGRKEMEEALEDELARALWDERRNIRPVGMVATVAPLLGLLGTVQGMIDAFRVAAETGMDNPALFAGGIYVALYTTAFGLIVAIPFLIIHHYLRGRSELILRRIEDRVLAYIARREFATEPEREAA